jgi:hypothetical protein
MTDFLLNFVEDNGEHGTLLPGSKNVFFNFGDAGFEEVLFVAEAIDGFVKRMNFSLCLNAGKFDCVFGFFAVLMMQL